MKKYGFNFLGLAILLVLSMPQCSLADLISPTGHITVKAIDYVSNDKEDVTSVESNVKKLEIKLASIEKSLTGTESEFLKSVVLQAVHERYGKWSYDIGVYSFNSQITLKTKTLDMRKHLGSFNNAKNFCQETSDKLNLEPNVIFVEQDVDLDLAYGYLCQIRYHEVEMKE
jgi:hypothetical protein